MRQLAYIETIKSVSPIEGADKIEKVEVLGWELVAKKNEFEVGDLCVYIEIDSIVPELPCFEFLRPKKFRVKTIKLKNQISQGLALPISVIKEVNPEFDLSKIKVGQDLTETLKIIKYEPEVELESIEPVKLSWWQKKVNYLKRLFGFKSIRFSRFPSDVPKTGETRVQNMLFTLWEKQGQPMYVTEKCEGTSSTFVFRKQKDKLFGTNYSFLVCGRNTTIYNSQKRRRSTHHLKRVADFYDLENKLKKMGRNIVIQGEVIGPNIQKNIYKLSNLELRVFLMFDLDKKEYLPFEEMIKLANELELKTVPILEVNHVLVDDVKYYVELSKGKSKINPNVLREGIVIRSLDKNFSFKSINPEYLLKNQL